MRLQKTHTVFIKIKLQIHEVRRGVEIGGRSEKNEKATPPASTFSFKTLNASFKVREQPNEKTVFIELLNNF